MPKDAASPAKKGSSAAGAKPGRGNSRGRRLPGSRSKVSSRHFLLTQVRQNGSQPIQSGPGGSDKEVPALLLAVPKRLLKRAVDRNIVRRAAKESWRLRRTPSSAMKTGALLRLTALPPDFSQTSRAQRKRRWRTEIDSLMDQYFGRHKHSAGL